MNKHYSRRDFLVLSAAAGAGGLLLTGCDPRSDAVNFSDKTPAKSVEYRALVCVFLHGGNDGYNMLVPTTADKYQLYSDSRLDLAVPRAQLLALNGAAADGAAYGLHPSCTELRQLFNGGRAAILANVGSLAAPASKADFEAGRVPPRLFSHNDQQDQWQSAHADVTETSGWAGRIADVLASANGSALLPMNITLAGANLLQTGRQRFAFGMTSGGASRLDALDPDGGAKALRATFDRIRALPTGNVLERRSADTLGTGISVNAAIEAALGSATELTTAFPDTNLGRQLRMVARLMAVRGALGMKRQIFFVSLGGFDTHDAQAADHPALLRQLSQGLSAFVDASRELGLEDAVTTFTASDFGRSLTTNGKGTDHGWSNHHFIVGGAVNGGRIYGTPPSLVVDGGDDSTGGRFIPSTSVDEYGATLARWFGVDDSDLGYVFPNIGRFGSRNLGFV